MYLPYIKTLENKKQKKKQMAPIMLFTTISNSFH